MFNDEGLLERGDVVRVVGRGSTTIEHALGTLRLPSDTMTADPTPRAPTDGVLPEPSGFRNLAPRARDVREAMGEGTKRVRAPSPPVGVTDVGLQELTSLTAFTELHVEGCSTTQAEARSAQGTALAKTTKCDKKDKDAMEKERLTSRRGGHHNYVPPKQAVFPEPGSLAYTDSYDRFQGNFAEHEFARRQEEMQHKKMILQNKADRAYAREAQRWEGIEAKFEYEQTAAADKLAQDAPHRNKGSVPYNLVSLKPDESYEAQMITFNEANVRVRAARRANKLYAHSVSQEYDLITGEPKNLSMVPVPEKPSRPVKPSTPQLQSKHFRVDRAFGDAMD